MATFQRTGNLQSAVAQLLNISGSPTGLIPVTQYGAVGDGVTDDTAAFTAALAAGFPVYVPPTSSFYKVTALTAAQQELLWGPGIIQVAGVEIPIQATPVVTNNGQAGVNTGGGSISIIKNTLAPAGNPSVGQGAINTQVKRTGGHGQYGNWVNQYLVTASIPASEFDSGITSWVTVQSMAGAGAAAFGMWMGANSPSVSAGHTYAGGAIVGYEVNTGNRWADFGYQTDLGGTRYTVGAQVVPDVVPAMDAGATSLSLSSITVASPCVVTVSGVANHGMLVNTPFQFCGTGSAPAPIVVNNPRAYGGTYYYVIAAGLTATTFRFSATIGGAAINTTSGSLSGAVTVYPYYPGTFGTATSASIWQHKWWVGSLLRQDCIAATGIGNLQYGASTAAAQPIAWTKLGAYFDTGLDMSSATITNNAINLATSQLIGWGGGANLTGNAAGGLLTTAGSASAYALTATGAYTRGIDLSGATFSGNNAIYLPASGNIYWSGNSYVTSTGSGDISVSTASTGTGYLWNGVSAPVKWGYNGSVGVLGFFNATPVAKNGAPAGVSNNNIGVGVAAKVDTNYSGNTGSTFYTVGDLVAILKNLGLISA